MLGWVVPIQMGELLLLDKYPWTKLIPLRRGKTRPFPRIEDSDGESKTQVKAMEEDTEETPSFWAVGEMFAPEIYLSCHSFVRPGLRSSRNRTSCRQEFSFVFCCCSIWLCSGQVTDSVESLKLLVILWHNGIVLEFFARYTF